MRLWILLLAVCFWGTSCNADNAEDEIAVELPPPSFYNDDMIASDSVSLSYETYMSLNPSQTKYSAQGGACYGDYFIQGFNYNSVIDIYDLKIKKFITQIEIPSPKKNSRYHSNTIGFGKEKYSEDDFFPLLYINSGYSSSTNSNVYYVFAYRLLLSIDSIGNKTFAIEHVQTIELSGFSTNSWIEAMVDSDKTSFWVKYNRSGYPTFAKFPIPDPHEVRVFVSQEHMTGEFSISKQSVVSHNQGHFIFNNRIYIPSGVPSWNEPILLFVINLEKKARELIINLADYGFVNSVNPCDNYYEPESIFIYEGKLMLAYRRVIYAIDIEIK